MGRFEYTARAMSPIDLSHIDDRLLPPKAADRPLERATTKLSEIRQQAKGIEYDSCPFPLHVIDPHAQQLFSRLLGVGQDKALFEVGGLAPLAWLEQIKGLCSHKIKASYLVGSAASAVAGRRLLRKGLTSLVQGLHIRSADLYKALERRVQRCAFPYNDVDLHVEIDKSQPLTTLVWALRQHAWPDEVTVTIDAFDDDHFVIVKIVDICSGVNLDVSVFSRRKSFYLVTRDALRVEIPEDPASALSLRYNCIDPWGWWRGHVLRVLERDANFETTHYVFPRVLNLLGTKQVVTSWGLEDRLYACWLPRIESGRIDNLFKDVAKQGREHEVCTLGRQVAICRWASVLKQREAPQLAKLFRQLGRGELNYEGASLFLQEAIRLLPKGSLAILELAGLLALHEAWSRPFSCKLELMDAKRWVLRLRFCGNFGRRDLLLRYQPQATLNELQSKQFDWEAMRPLLHLLWQQPVKQREATSNYTQKLVSLQPWVDQLKRTVFSRSNAFCPQELCFAQHSSLAALFESQCDDLRELSDLGELLVAGRAGTSDDRARLCWKIIDRLQSAKYYHSAGALIRGARERAWEPVGGWDTRFCKTLALPGPQLWEAYAPRELSFDWEALQKLKPTERATAALHTLDAPEIAASRYLAFASGLAVRPSGVSAQMLCRLRSELSIETWANWLRSQWKKSERKHPELCEVLSRELVQCAKEGRSLPFPMKWLLPFVLDTQRFIASAADKEELFCSLVEAGIAPKEQEALLRTWDLRSPRLWNSVVQAYLLSEKGSLPEALRDRAFANPKQFLSWCEVLRLEAPERVLTLLNGELLEIDPPGGRALIAVSWLARGPGGLRADLLTALYPESGLKAKHWVRLFNDSKDCYGILRGLIHYKRFSLATLLFLAIRPDDQRYEYLYREWAELCYLAASQDPKQLQDSNVLACLRLSPSFFVQRLLKKLPAKTSCQAIHKLRGQRKELNILELSAQLEAALELDPSGKLAANIERSWGVKHKNPHYQRLRRCIACAQLADPGGDLRFALEIYAESGTQDMHAVFPGQNRLRQLLRVGGVQWVTGIVQLASTQELASLTTGFYSDLLRHLPSSALEQRGIVLLRSPEDSSIFRAQWELCAGSQQLQTEQRAALLARAHRFAVSDAELLEPALSVLAQLREEKTQIGPRLRDFLFDLMGRLPQKSAAHRLWCALEKSTRSLRQELWDRALLWAQEESLPDEIVSWLFSARSKQQRSELTGVIPLAADFWTQTQLEHYVLPFLRKEEGTTEAFWGLLEGAAALGLPSYSDVVAHRPGPKDRKLLNRLIQERIQNASFDQLQDACLLCLCYKLDAGLAAGEEFLKRKDPRQTALQEALRLTLTSKSAEMKADPSLHFSQQDLIDCACYPELCEALIVLAQAQHKEQISLLSLRLCEERLVHQDEPSCDDIFHQLQGIRIYIRHSKASCTGLNEIERFCLRFCEKLLPKLTLEEAATHLTLISDVLLIERPFRLPAQRRLRAAIRPYHDRFPRANARSSCMRLMLGACTSGGLHSERKKEDAAYFMELCDEYWRRGDYESDIRDIIQAQNICYQRHASKIGLDPLDLGYVAHLIGIWPDLASSKRPHAVETYMARAIKAALDQKSASRVEQLGYYLRDALSILFAEVDKDVQLGWCEQVFDAALELLSKERLLELLPELLLPYPDLDELEGRELWYRSLLSNSQKLLQKYPAALGRLLDVLAVHYQVVCADLPWRQVLKELIVNAAKRARAGSVPQEDYSSFCALLEPSQSELAPAQLGHVAMAGEELADYPSYDVNALWKYPSANTHHYTLGMQLRATAQWMDLNSEQLCGVDCCHLYATIFRTPQIASVIESANFRTLRQLSSLVRETQELYALKIELERAAVAKEIRIQLLGCALFTMSSGQALPADILDELRQHSRSFLSAWLNECASKYAGPLGVQSAQTPRMLTRALDFIIIVFAGAPEHLHHAEAGLRTISEALMATKMAAVSLFGLIKGMAQHLRFRADQLCAPEQQELLIELVRMLQALAHHAANFPNPRFQEIMAPISRLTVLLRQPTKQTEIERYLLELRSPECFLYQGVLHPATTSEQVRAAVCWFAECIELQPERKDHFSNLMGVSLKMLANE